MIAFALHGARAARPALIQHQKRQGKSDEDHEDRNYGASREAHELPVFLIFVALALPFSC